MCFSAPASLIAAVLLMPAGVLGTYKAYRVDRRYVPICALPVLFGMQQLLEGLVWRSGETADLAGVGHYSLAYMFFAWLLWPVWVPTATYFLEPPGRKALYLAFVILGAILGAGQYLPYFAHQGWLTVTFLPHVIVYGGTEMFDFLMAREFTYTIYVTAVILPLLLSSQPEIRVFGALVVLVLLITFVFFQFAYISVFCFGGALMSFYLVGMIFWKAHRRPVGGCQPQAEGT
jgi:hypothetical protein